MTGLIFKNYSETFFEILCSYHQHIDHVSLTQPTYNMLKTIYNIPDEQISDSNVLINELKYTQLEH